MDRLELLRYVSDDLYPTTKLDNVLLIACQHLLGTTYEMFEELLSKGLKPENTFLIGKCYSTHRGTYRKFQQRGVHVSPFSHSYNSRISFDEQFLIYIQKFLMGVVESVSFEKYRRVIILDDGGHLLFLINSSLNYFRNVIGIEQTSSGYQRLLSTSLNFPVINVARSTAKLEIESPMIAKIVIEKIEHYLLGSRSVNQKILVIGRGSIGQRILDLLQAKYRVSVCDVLEERCDFSGNYKEHLADFDIIIGTTGSTVIVPDDYRLLKKALSLLAPHHLTQSSLPFLCESFQQKTTIAMKTLPSTILNFSIVVSLSISMEQSTAFHESKHNLHALCYYPLYTSVSRRIQKGLKNSLNWIEALKKKSLKDLLG